MKENSLFMKGKIPFLYGFKIQGQREISFHGSRIMGAPPREAPARAFLKRELASARENFFFREKKTSSYYSKFQSLGSRQRKCKSPPMDNSFFKEKREKKLPLIIVNFNLQEVGSGNVKVHPDFEEKSVAQPKVQLQKYLYPEFSLLILVNFNLQEVGSGNVKVHPDFFFHKKDNSL